MRLGTRLVLYERVVGRITEEHLFEAEKTFPGIINIYCDLDTKPTTFLQLVYIYETIVRG